MRDDSYESPVGRRGFFIYGIFFPFSISFISPCACFTMCGIPNFYLLCEIISRTGKKRAEEPALNYFPADIYIFSQYSHNDFCNMRRGF
jgi:hypothetical protein